MAATETSVVVALKEVRRLELERQRREEESRKAALDEERARLTGERASVQYGPGMAPFGNSWGNEGVPDGFNRPVHRTSEVMTVGSGSFAAPQSYVGGQAPPQWEGPAFAADKPRRSVFPVVLATLVVCGVAAGVGAYQLNAGHERERSVLAAERHRAEQARNEAVAAREKAEQELKLRVTELEGKLAAASAKASAASTALAIAARAPTPAAAPPLPAARAAGRRGRAARAAVVKAPAIAAPLPKPAPVLPAAPAPKVAKKKSLSDDPLGGLRL